MNILNFVKKLANCFIPGESRGELMDKLGEFKTGVGDAPLTQYWGEMASVYDRTPREFQIALEDGSCFTAHFFCSEIIVKKEGCLIAFNYKTKELLSGDFLFYKTEGEQNPHSEIVELKIAYAQTFSSGEPYRHSLPSANSQEFHDFMDFINK